MDSSSEIPRGRKLRAAYETLLLQQRAMAQLLNAGETELVEHARLLGLENEILRRAIVEALKRARHMRKCASKLYGTKCDCGLLELAHLAGKRRRS